MAHRGGVFRNAHTNEDSRSGKYVSVARTLAYQQEVDDFLNVTGRHAARMLGRDAMVGTLGYLHITLLESRGTRRDFGRKGYTRQDVHTFSGDLQQYLHNREGTQGAHVVTINPEEPFKWYGKNLLAFNIMPDPRLRTERQHIEDFLAEKLGRVPKLRKLDEHIVFGRFTNVSSDAYNHPELLLPECAEIPANIALNGLAVFFNGVGEPPGSATPVRLRGIIDQQR